MIKRLMDVLAAGAGLVVLSPVLLAAAVMIRRDSPGPVFFRQERVGRRGVPFHIYKFRTMRADAGSAGPAVTVGQDPRITIVGAFLRRAKIDELPQLINVVLGDMSLVGPRPEVPKYVAKWPEKERRIILSVRPGITDPASIRFRNESEVLAQYPDPEAAYETVILPEKVRLYVDYVRTNNPATDLLLILRTLTAITRG